VNQRLFLAELESCLSKSLSDKIPDSQLSAARLSTEWQIQSESSFKISDCKLLKDYMALVAFEIGLGKIQICQAKLLLLLARIAKRNINEVRATPPPATFAAQCMNHLLNCSNLLLKEGRQKSVFEGAWAELVSTASSNLGSLLQKPLLHLGDLETSIFDNNTTNTLTRLCHELTSDFNLFTQIAEVVAMTFDRYFAQAGQLPQNWVSLDQSLRAQMTSHDSQRVHEEFKAYQPLFDTLSAHQQELLSLQFKPYLIQLVEVADALAEFIEQLESFDDKLFAQNQFSATRSPLKAPKQSENQLIVLALAQRLRMNGENMDDIENFARGLLDYSQTHQTSCLGMLEEELSKLAPRIAPQVLSKSLAYVRISDPSFPLSIFHKTRIMESIERSEQAALSLSKNQSMSEVSLTASVPGVTSSNRSP
jgi:hypothetical protein